jgi:hypothetical protein
MPMKYQSALKDSVINYVKFSAVDNSTLCLSLSGFGTLYATVYAHLTNYYLPGIIFVDHSFYNKYNNTVGTGIVTRYIKKEGFSDPEPENDLRAESFGSRPTDCAR